MKKIVMLSVAFVIAFSMILAACGDSESAAPAAKNKDRKADIPPGEDVRGTGSYINEEKCSGCALCVSMLQ